MSSAEQTDLSGSQTDLSGSQTDLSGSQTDLSGSQTDLSGSQTDLSGSQPSPSSESAAPTVVPLLSIDDLLNVQELLEQKEATDRSSIETFVNPSIDALRPVLYEWAKAKFPDLYTIRTLTLTPPRLCSDGQERSLLVYYEYLIGVSMAESLTSLTSKVQGMTFSFSHNGSNSISLLISRS